jgi:hypothetical protein
MTSNSAAVTVGCNWAVDKFVSPEHVQDMSAGVTFESRAFTSNITTINTAASATTTATTTITNTTYNNSNRHHSHHDHHNNHKNHNYHNHHNHHNTLPAQARACKLKLNSQSLWLWS